MSNQTCKVNKNYFDLSLQQDAGEMNQSFVRMEVIPYFRNIVLPEYADKMDFGDDINVDTMIQFGVTNIEDNLILNQLFWDTYCDRKIGQLDKRNFIIWLRKIILENHFRWDKLLTEYHKVMEDEIYYSYYSINDQDNNTSEINKTNYISNDWGTGASIVKGVGSTEEFTKDNMDSSMLDKSRSDSKQDSLIDTKNHSIDSNKSVTLDFNNTGNFNTGYTGSFTENTSKDINVNQNLNKSEGISDVENMSGHFDTPQTKQGNYLDSFREGFRGEVGSTNDRPNTMNKGYLTTGARSTDFNSNISNTQNTVNGEGYNKSLNEIQSKDLSNNYTNQENVSDLESYLENNSFNEQKNLLQTEQTNINNQLANQNHEAKTIGQSKNNQQNLNNNLSYKDYIQTNGRQSSNKQMNKNFGWAGQQKFKILSEFAEMTVNPYKLIIDDFEELFLYVGSYL